MQAAAIPEGYMQVQKNGVMELRPIASIQVMDGMGIKVPALYEGETIHAALGQPPIIVQGQVGGHRQYEDPTLIAGLSDW